MYTFYVIFDVFCEFLFSVKHFSVVTFYHLCLITPLMVKYAHQGWTEV